MYAYPCLFGAKRSTASYEYDMHAPLPSTSDLFLEQISNCPIFTSINMEQVMNGPKTPKPLLNINALRYTIY